MKQRNKVLLSELGLLSAALVWGAGFVVMKHTLDGISAHWLLAIRFVIAAAATTLFFFKQLKKLDVKTILYGVLAGLFIYLGFLAQTIGVQHTTASKNAVLTASYVVFVPFVFWLLQRKKPKGVHIISALLCFAGVALLLYRKGMNLTDLNVGDLYTLLCGLFFAIHIAVLGIACKKHNPLALTTVQMITCCIISVAVAFWREPMPESISLETGLSLLYLGLMCTFFAYLMQTIGQKYAPPSHASIILSLECLFGCVLSVLVLHDSFTPSMWLGAGLAFLAVIISQRADSTADA